MIVSLFAAAALLSAGDPDGVITTAPEGPRAVTVESAAAFTDASPGDAVQQTPHGLTTEQQIDRWLQSRADGVAPFEDGALTELPAYERRMHGQVSASVGSHGYRGYSATVDLPIGESSWLSLGVAKSEGGFGYPHGARAYPYGGSTYGFGYRTGVMGSGEPSRMADGLND